MPRETLSSSPEITTEAELEKAERKQVMEALNEHAKILWSEEEISEDQSEAARNALVNTERKIGPPQFYKYRDNIYARMQENPANPEFSDARELLKSALFYKLGELSNEAINAIHKHMNGEISTDELVRERKRAYDNARTALDKFKEVLGKEKTQKILDRYQETKKEINYIPHLITV